MIKKDFRFREIPYNYTSLSDKEIILRYFDESTWNLMNELRAQRVTGRSAKLLYEIIGDIFVIQRNPYLFEDFLNNPKKYNSLKNIHEKRISAIIQSSQNNVLVKSLVEKTKTLNHEFFKSFSKTKSLRNKILFALTGVTSRKNIHFSPFHRVSHATDATDWRVEYPCVVIYPDTIQEIPKLIKAACELELTIIPRGGGTGLTGGAVPVKTNTMIINTEKLNHISEIEKINDDGRELSIINLEAGVVTDDAIEYCESKGYIFATDPTSAWASTIGGNVAENAGGKKCVMWGTAIDNLYSYTLVDAKGNMIKIKRKNHPCRKIYPEDIVEFEVFKRKNKKEIYLNTISLKGIEIRKKGLGKDITNKALNGLPGLQKEGGDGIIVSAQFVLYVPFKNAKTICLEFYGTNMINASKSIVELTSMFETDEYVFLTALEHFDEKYVTAINYRNKSARNETPKAVLLIDIESEDKNRLDTACDHVVELVKKYNCEGIIAHDERERKLFWNDRKHLGAIAKHTNAFKLNEDVVIPLDKLPEFADFIELLNFEKEVANLLTTIAQIEDFLQQIQTIADRDFPVDRLKSFKNRLEETRREYSDYYVHLQSYRLSNLSLNSDGRVVFERIREGSLKFSFNEKVVDFFQLVFHGYENILTEFTALVQNCLTKKIMIATHMHAGDGNVHVNIPVHSSDYLMMQEADDAASLAMKEAARLGGVVSGEHGIGLTKLKFIDQEILDSYQQYKKQSDPGDIFNPGKLNRDFPLYKIYTPSFNLLECEAIILESTDLELLSNAIATCVRCGKCKSVCNTHYPKGTMMYNPRNKILAVGIITEAILFSAQTMDMRSFKHFTKLREIADHCTVCHKCQVPCPVKIDFGDVSLTMRKQLIHRKKSSAKLFTSVALLYLSRKKYFINKFFRIAILKLGYTLQRWASFTVRPISKYIIGLAPKLFNMLQTPFPKSGAKSIRETFKLSGQSTFYSFENPNIPVAKSVIYFPGCGSERMSPEISMATIALLYNSGVRVVIPHEFLCCGYPFMANGRTDQADIKSYENRVLFHRIADTAGYMNIETVIISCGTCHEMLQKYDIQNIFNRAELIDINEFLVKEKLYSKNALSKQPLIYHEPCHSPLKHFGAEHTFKNLFNENAIDFPNCCGEAGTLALSRPDISNILKERKSNNLRNITTNNEVEILTTCPSCVLGLSKLNGNYKVNGKSLAVYNAEQFLGKNWQRNFIREIKKNGIDKILF